MDVYHFDVELDKSWGGTDILWGALNVSSAESLVDGNVAPGGPAFKDAWNNVGSTGTISRY